MRTNSRRWGSSDNTHWRCKLDLRQRFAEKVGADTCFDLFCGTGTFTDAVWAPRFGQVICVDKLAKQLEQLPDLPNVTAYIGDNAKLLTGLLVRHGWPDVFDLDAYGSPDELVSRIMASRLADRPFAIITTDGGMAARQRGSANAVPRCWGFGKDITVAQQSAGMDASATRAYTFLRQWADAGAKRVIDFEAHVDRAIMYWAALITPQEAG